MANYVPRPTPLPSNRSVRQHFSMREAYEAWLYGLDKVTAPSRPIEVFNSFWEEATGNYYQKRYNIYDSSQQVTDDLRELSATRVFTPTSTPPLDQTKEEVPLPDDYWHTLSVTSFYEALSDFRTLRQGEIVNYPAERLNADRVSFVRNDYYNRPSYHKPGYLTRDTYLEIHAGIHEKMRLAKVELTYLMQPERAELRETDLDDETVDNSYVLRQRAEVTREILKECLHLTLENMGNPRLGTKAQVDQTVPQTPPMPAGAAPAPRR